MKVPIFRFSLLDLQNKFAGTHPIWNEVPYRVNFTEEGQVLEHQVVVKNSKQLREIVYKEKLSRSHALFFSEEQFRLYPETWSLRPQMGWYTVGYRWKNPLLTLVWGIAGWSTMMWLFT